VLACVFGQTWEINMIHVNKELLVVSFWCVASCSFVVVDDDEEEDEDEDGDDEDEDEDED
jgi:hypothetical protein